MVAAREGRTCYKLFGKAKGHHFGEGVGGGNRLDGNVPLRRVSEIFILEKTGVFT